MTSTEKELCILEILLKENRWMYGLEIIKASGGILKRGTVYVYLHKLENVGLVESRAESVEEKTSPLIISVSTQKVTIRRRQYRITPGGRIHYAQRTMEQKNSSLGDTEPLPEPA